MVVPDTTDMKTLFLLSVVFLTGCVTPPTKYVGVIRRDSDGQPVSDISVRATATPILRSFLIFPRHEINVGLTRSGADGTFTFMLPYASHRLSFSALGTPVEHALTSGVAVSACGNAIVHHPSPDRQVVITIPDTFRPLHSDIPR
jgi:hypothetical protein